MGKLGTFKLIQKDITNSERGQSRNTENGNRTSKVDDAPPCSTYVRSRGGVHRRATERSGNANTNQGGTVGKSGKLNDDSERSKRSVSTKRRSDHINDILSQSQSIRRDMATVGQLAQTPGTRPLALITSSTMSLTDSSHESLDESLTDEGDTGEFPCDDPRLLEHGELVLTVFTFANVNRSFTGARICWKCRCGDIAV